MFITTISNLLYIWHKYVNSGSRRGAKWDTALSVIVKPPYTSQCDLLLKV